MMLYGHRRCGKCGLLGHKKDMVLHNWARNGLKKQEEWYHKACYKAMGYKRCDCGKDWVRDNDKAIKAALQAAVTLHDKELARYKHIAAVATELPFDKIKCALINVGFTGSAARIEDLGYAINLLHAKDEEKVSP